MPQLRSDTRRLKQLQGIYSIMSKEKDEKARENFHRKPYELSNKCVACGKVIPEGRQICADCETKSNIKFIKESIQLERGKKNV